MIFLPASYDATTVLASLLIATLASYVALDLAKRVRASDRGTARAWWLGGSLVMGTGIWCMHFVGMLAFSLPIELGYTRGLTALSWLAGVAVSAVALYVAGQGTLGWPRLVGGSLAMGAGICVMHYTGMAAIDLAPGIVWNPWLVAVSALIAVVASAAALMIFFGLRTASSRGLPLRVLAALVMGVAICGMHYTGMAAAAFPDGAVCLSVGQLGGTGLGVVVGAAAVALLSLTLFASVLDAQLRSRNARLARSLRESNAELLRVNEALSRQALQDALTGLPNRALFDDRLRHALQRCERAAVEAPIALERLSVLFVDLDGFKAVNDSLGHAAGDDLLRQAAERLRAAARVSDTCARIGGDEFVLLLEAAGSVADTAATARRLVSMLGLPYQVQGRAVEISASVGVVVYPDQCGGDKLLPRADAAMYAAKRAGGNTFAFFESQMASDVEEQLGLQGELRHAVERGQLRLLYQPKVDGRLGTVRAVEALVRWHHPERGTIPPAVFIPLAERFGLISGLGEWVIEEACRQVAAWSAQGLQVSVAVNVSMHQLRDARLAACIADALARHRVRPDQLLCEITESAAMEDVKATERSLEGLQRCGVFVSIDDFGTGYSSLSHLRQMPARELKIDRSFVMDLEASADARAVVSAIVHLAHELGLRVVAEGVETRGQRDILVELGCDELQGYYYARPMPPESLLSWLRPDGGPGAEGHVDAACAGAAVAATATPA